MRRMGSVLASVTLVAGLAGPAAAQVAPDPGPDPDPGLSTDYQQVVDITFPADVRASFTDTYDACRSGCARVHKATDIMGAQLYPLYAAVDGVICSITGVEGPMPSYGYALTICGDDGREYHYLHINNDTPETDDGLGGVEWAYAPGLRRGARVVRGQFVAYMGDSGNAEASRHHLHFEIRDPGVIDPYGDSRINPAPSLRAALDRGDVRDGSPPPPVPAAGPADRVFGQDRIGTAIALSTGAFDTAETVVLAPAESPAEAIVAGPLAAALDAPVLTTASGELDPRVAAELARLGTTGVVLVGALAPGVEATLTASGFAPERIERIVGADRFETAALVARRIWDLQDAAATDPRADLLVDLLVDPLVDQDQDPTARTAVVALGEHTVPSRAWPDSLMASWYGSVVGSPVLLVSDRGIPDATAAALDGVDEVTIFGGPAAVPDDIETAIDAAGAEVRRLRGQTRYSTALAVTDDLLTRGLASTTRVWTATGLNWPDAATSGPIVAAAGDVLVLVDGKGQGSDAETTQWLRARASGIERARAIGGGAAVADAALVQVSRSIA